MKRFYIKQKVFKITDHYPILDEGGNPQYYVDQDFKVIGNTVHVSDKDKNPLFTIDKVVLSIPSRFIITFKDGREIAIQNKWRILQRKLVIEMENKNLYVEGDFLSREFILYDGDKIFGSFTRKLISWGDTFELTVNDESIQDEIIAVLIAVDNIIDVSQNT